MASTNPKKKPLEVLEKETENANESNVLEGSQMCGKMQGKKSIQNTLASFMLHLDVILTQLQRNLCVSME